ncbi:MAG: hypothetical protein ABI389_16490, partial [Rhodanobacter sp.]
MGTMARQDRATTHHTAMRAHVGTTTAPAKAASLMQRVRPHTTRTPAVMPAGAMHHGTMLGMDHGAPIAVQGHADHDMSHTAPQT